MEETNLTINANNNLNSRVEEGRDDNYLLGTVVRRVLNSFSDRDGDYVSVVISHSDDPVNVRLLEHLRYIVWRAASLVTRVKNDVTGFFETEVSGYEPECSMWLWKIVHELYAISTISHRAIHIDYQMEGVIDVHRIASCRLALHRNWEFGMDFATSVVYACLNDQEEHAMSLMGVLRKFMVSMSEKYNYLRGKEKFVAVCSEVSDQLKPYSDLVRFIKSPFGNITVYQIGFRNAYRYVPDTQQFDMFYDSTKLVDYTYTDGIRGTSRWFDLNLELDNEFISCDKHTMIECMLTLSYCTNRDKTSEQNRLIDLKFERSEGCYEYEFYGLAKEGAFSLSVIDSNS